MFPQVDPVFGQHAAVGAVKLFKVCRKCYKKAKKRKTLRDNKSFGDQQRDKVAKEVGASKTEVTSNTPMGNRRHDVLYTNAKNVKIRMEIKTGYVRLSNVKRQVEKDVFLSGKGRKIEWRFYPGRKGGKGPDKALRDALEGAGIDVQVY